ncbi:urea amidolyase [Irpex rosettiformis]|uniref:Urea amidolyase n=1 Tax=Irpex rosettiformis TaxID=378272 RepID=A0ACB8TQD3_9APHY|nr:urea amidolyase [Irpex rosettiformis]
MDHTSTQKLLIANRGEIALRILKTAKRLGIPTVAIYTHPDASAPHVLQADEAVPLYQSPPPTTSTVDNAHGYLDVEAILNICIEHAVTLVHPGYGFLSENAEFAGALLESGVTWVGPRPDVMRSMGLKHLARRVAREAGVPVVPGGEEGLVENVDEAVRAASGIGYPVVLKATAGGGGMGMVVCYGEEDVRSKLSATRDRAVSLFRNGGMYVERYIVSARHIEVQVFGDGKGRVIHMGERECSVQRRHQKVIEEAPSPFMAEHPDIRDKMCKAAVDLCTLIKYNSAGTVEFVVDDTTGEFFFLEMNTRIQVEHTVTESICPGLDIVQLMLYEALANQHPSSSSSLYYINLLSPSLSHTHHHFTTHPNTAWSIQARIYAENPSANFTPTPGVLQHVSFPSSSSFSSPSSTTPLEQEHDKWLRIDTWISSGTLVTPHYDPLLAKIIVLAPTRDDAVRRMVRVLGECRIWGTPNNVQWVRAVCAEGGVFKDGRALTGFVGGFEFTPRAMDVLNGGIETTVQDYPGRELGMGVPRSGPMDTLAFRIANLVVGNTQEGTEGLEITLARAVEFRAVFHVDAVVCVTGADARVTVGGEEVGMWGRVVIPRGSVFVIGGRRPSGGEQAEEEGMRTYLAVRGGFPEVPTYLGSKSTSMGLGGYQGRSLRAGDQLALSPSCTPSPSNLSHPLTLPPHLTPSYPSSHHWIIHVLSGPHSSVEYITPPGLTAFLSTHWKVTSSSNRMGIRLQGPKVDWARDSGGQGGSHPSNVLDGGYAEGSVNLNGDTPVVLGPEGPDMGGYVCVCVVASADMWKLGQLCTDDTIQFECVSFDGARELSSDVSNHLEAIKRFVSDESQLPPAQAKTISPAVDNPPLLSPLLKLLPPLKPTQLRAEFRQAGDKAILVEYASLKDPLSIPTRARIHAFETSLRSLSVPGIRSLSPCIRSTLIRFDPSVVSQARLLEILVHVESALEEEKEGEEEVFEGRKITFPVVLDDPWTREAVERYMGTVRDEAVYLPSNVEYLARNNGVDGREEVLDVLVKSNWLVFGVGFYLGCPFLVPIDPRCRLIAQKMNPSRTYTPRGALGIAGPVAAIYPTDSPGGYQLFGRTLPPWQTWGRGEDFSAGRPWLLRPFDQLSFEVVSEAEYSKLEAQFDAGQYKFKIEPARFSVAEYNAFVATIQPEVDEFRRRQAEGAAREEAKERELLSRWEVRKRVKREADLASSSLELSGTERTDGTDESASHVASSMNASVWKLVRRPGYTVKTPEDVLVVLEAMKTEINVVAGEENVGRTVKGYAQGVREGAVVHPGQTLVYLV